MLPGNERTKPPLAARASAALALAALAACLACLVLARPALASPSYSDVGERGWYGGPHGCVRLRLRARLHDGLRGHGPVRPG